MGHDLIPFISRQNGVRFRFHARSNIPPRQGHTASLESYLARSQGGFRIGMSSHAGRQGNVVIREGAFGSLSLPARRLGGACSYHQAIQAVTYNSVVGPGRMVFGGCWRPPTRYLRNKGVSKVEGQRFQGRDVRIEDMEGDSR